jgi:hypothetical protein
MILRFLSEFVHLAVLRLQNLEIWSKYVTLFFSFLSRGLIKRKCTLTVPYFKIFEKVASLYIKSYPIDRKARKNRLFFTLSYYKEKC